MAYAESIRRRNARVDHHPQGEDTVVILSLIVVAVLGLTLGTLLFVSFVGALPSGVGIVLVLCLLVSIAVVGNAILSRVLSLPSVYRGGVPIIGQRRRRPLTRYR